MCSLKNPTFRGGSSQKERYRGGDCLKRWGGGGGVGQFEDLRGAWQERGGGVFEEG